MTHYKSMFDSDKDAGLLFACHLNFADLTLTIKSVVKGKITGAGGKSSGKPLVTFADHERKLALNKTNGATLTALFGSPDTDKWIGKRITLYPTTTTFGADMVECIRIRPIIPAAVQAQDDDFDTAGWCAAFADCSTVAEVDALRAKVNAAKPPKAATAAIKSAIDEARARIAGSGS